MDVAVVVAVGWGVAVSVGSEVGVAVGADVAVAVGCGVLVAVAVGVAVADAVGVAVGRAVLVAVGATVAAPAPDPETIVMYAEETQPAWFAHVTGCQPPEAEPRNGTVAPSARTVITCAEVFGAVRQFTPAPPVPLMRPVPLDGAVAVGVRVGVDALVAVRVGVGPAMVGVRVGVGTAVAGGVTMVM